MKLTLNPPVWIPHWSNCSNRIRANRANPRRLSMKIGIHTMGKVETLWVFVSGFTEQCCRGCPQPRDYRIMTRERRNSRSPRGFPPGKKVFFTDEICQTTKTLLSSGSSRVHKSICREHKGTRSWTWIVWFSSIGYGLIIHRIRNSYVTMDFVITTSPSVLAMINQ